MQFPDRSDAIELHKGAARRHRSEGNHAAARAAYFKWAESEKQQNIRTGGQREAELAAAQQEYSEFVLTDPLYQQIRDAAVQTISDQPGILQTALYKALPQFERTDIQYALYFADAHGAIVREKKGRSYSLAVP